MKQIKDTRNILIPPGQHVKSPFVIRVTLKQSNNAVIESCHIKCAILFSPTVL